MKNKYLNYISDDHLIKCVARLHNAYVKAKSDISKKNFTLTKLIQSSLRSTRNSML